MSDDSGAPTPIIPGYVFHSILGSGGFGLVCLMKEDSDLGVPRAVKVLSPIFHKVEDDERFKREAMAISILKHSSIVGYVSSGFTDTKQPYIVMDYVEGYNFNDFLSGGVEFVERATIFLYILEAIEYAHSLQILHRDIKPSNIIIRRSDNKPVVLDFGLAYLFDNDSNSITSTAMGTSGRIPPEVITNPKIREVGHDIYSCGILLYESFASRIPNYQNYVSLSSIDSMLIGLDKIVQKAIAPVKDRYRNIKEMKSNLSEWIERYKLITTLSGPTSNFREKLITHKLEQDREVEEQKIRMGLINAADRDFRTSMNMILSNILESTHHELTNVFGGRFILEKYDVAKIPSEPSGDVVFPLISIKDTKSDRQLIAALQPPEFIRDRSWDIIDEIKNHRIQHGLIKPKIQFLPYGIYLFIKGSMQSPNRILLACFVALSEFESNNTVIYGKGRGRNLGKFSSYNEVNEYLRKIIEAYYSDRFF